MDSDDSNQTVFNTISNFDNSDLKISDEFFEAELRPTSFSQPLFQPIASPFPDETTDSPSSHTDTIPILSPPSRN